MEALKVKFQCECRQKIRVPASKVARLVECPGCRREVVVPPPRDETILEIICRCGASVPPGVEYCATCGLEVIGQIERDIDRRAPDAPESASSRRRARASHDFTGPLAIPGEHEPGRHLLVKFLCTCGQKVRLKVKQAEAPGTCPRCEVVLIFPDLSIEEEISVLCGCEAPVSADRESCPDCGRRYFQNLAPPPPPSAATPSTERLSPEPFEEREPAASAPLARAPLPPGALAKVPPRPPQIDGASPRHSDRSAGSPSERRLRAGSRGRNRRRRDLLPIAVFLIGTGVSAAGIGWLYFGGRLTLGEEVDSPEGREVPAETDRATLFDRGSDPFGSPSGPASPDSLPPEPEPPRPEPEPPRPEPEPPRPEPEPPRPEPEPPRPEPEPPRHRYADRHEVSIGGENPAPPAAAGEVAAGKEPDLEFFRQRVQPSMHGVCMTCHANPVLPTGNLKLQASSSGRYSSSQSRKNFDAILAYVDRNSPEKSLFVLKPLNIADGGSEHGGGDRIGKADDAYRMFVGFARGQSVGDARPTAVAGPPRWEDVGGSVSLDGSQSRDPVGEPLSYRWEVVVKPNRSGGRVFQGFTAEPSLRLDRAGAYLVGLVVTDSNKNRSDPSYVLIQAREPATDADRVEPPTGIDRAMKLAAIEQLYRDLLGREPDEAERGRAFETSIEALVAELHLSGLAWGRWFDRQLGHLGMTGPHRPRVVDLASIPARLANGEITVVEALGALVSSGAFSERYPDAGDRNAVLARRLLGDESATFEKPASVLADPEFAPLFLARRYHELVGELPPVESLEGWADRFRSDPKAYAEIVSGWLTSSAYLER